MDLDVAGGVAVSLESCCDVLATWRREGEKYLVALVGLFDGLLF